jgi:ferric-dicitrate binding protein FerR (iron transport regulator)
MRWELLDRFLRGACDDAERAEILRWAAESPRHRQVLDELAQVVGAAEDAPSIRIEWERLRRELEIRAESDDKEKPDQP